MNIYISGEKGFIGKNLVKRIAKIDNLSVINFQMKEFLKKNNKGEIDFVINSIEEMISVFKRFKVECIVHNGAIVGTDVVALYPQDAIMSNVYGTYALACVAKKMKIPIVYLGTTVIYDTQKIQDKFIDEQSPIMPRTLYASNKYEGELIIKSHCSKSGYAIIRPLFCYGGIGDMNSLIAKSIFNDLSGRRKKFKIFLDPKKIKDYMHVYDFVESIIQIILNESYNKNTDFNISFGKPQITSNIVEILESKNISCEQYIEWVPNTDYLGNHIICPDKFLKFHKWNPTIDIYSGIDIFIEECKMSLKNSLYDPLKHIDEISKREIKIEEAYNYEK